MTIAGREADVAHPRWVRDLCVSELPPDRVDKAKKAFTTRRVPFESASSRPSIHAALLGMDDCRRRMTLLSGPVRPRSGDLLLAKVSRVGHHTKIELTDGRRSALHVGDEIVVTYADRYAPDQFESHVPKDLSATHLVASGGIASTSLSRHEKARRPTEIEPIGLIGDASGEPLNVAQFAIQPTSPTCRRPRTLAVVGTSMNSGKTTAVGSLVHGLHRAGRAPGATKVTGTGSGVDYWVMVDAGAHRVVDFTDAGMASTFRIPYNVVEASFVRLIDDLTNAGCTEIVIEIADGIYQQETARLIRSEVFRTYVDSVVFAAADSMGAVSGACQLDALGLPLVGLSGMFTRGPLGVCEVEANTDVPVFTKEQLCSPQTATALLSGTPEIDLHTIDASARMPTVAAPPSPLRLVDLSTSNGAAARHEVVPAPAARNGSGAVAVPAMAAEAPYGDSR